jgi:putative Mg2+ transporter-C (MgtC) family protein
LIPWHEVVLRLLLAVGLAAVLGTERELRGKAAGLRTHILIGVGSAGFTLASFMGFTQADAARVASGVVAGVGFLGAGVIFRGDRGSSGGISGLTTAASIWVTACVGTAAAVGLVVLAIAVTVVALVALELPKLRD